MTFKVEWRNGFTIVELLIVIVVIAIIASIIVVAYGGIKQRASVSAASSDFVSIAKSLEMYSVSNGKYPAGATAFSTMQLKVNKNLYRSSSGTNNMLYCKIMDSSATIVYNYLLIAELASGGSIYVTDTQKNPQLSSQQVINGGASICSSMGYSTSYWEWMNVSGVWNDSYVQ